MEIGVEKMEKTEKMELKKRKNGKKWKIGVEKTKKTEKMS